MLTATATDAVGNSAEMSVTVTLNPETIAMSSIWNEAASPVSTYPSSVAIEMGVKFRSDIDGHVSALRFYKMPGATGLHIGQLWAADGTLLATATFTDETDSGWQVQDLDSPVSINADTTYIASYHAPLGQFAMDTGYFASGGVDSAPLRALADGVDGGNGVYRVGAAGSFPDVTYASSNFWADIVFVPALPQ